MAGSRIRNTSFTPMVAEAELETIGATRGIALIDAGKWKQRDTWVHFPPSWIRQILEMFARGDLSLLNPTQPKHRRKRARSKAGAVKPPT